MIFQPFMFEAGPLEVNLYVLADESTRDGILSDAGVYHPSVIDFVKDEGLKIKAILITHLHPDHIGGIAEYLRAWSCDVFAPAPIPAVPTARIVGEGDIIRCAGFEFHAYKTSGHTPESVSYYCERERFCLVWDAIFAGAVGGTSSDALHAEEIGHLRRVILELPPETELLSGHGPVTTVAIEKKANPFLKPGFGRTA
ncbi:MBL fold metallo-hydrolase [Candidatus Sumerlaeota bacterium]|nr:MBL fold metallo-hydrolase [Candidatus Sumerlaeota bacterium]